MNARDRFSCDLSFYTLLPQRIVYARTRNNVAARMTVFFKVEAGLTAVWYAPFCSRKSLSFFLDHAEFLLMFFYSYYPAILTTSPRCPAPAVRFVIASHLKFFIATDCCSFCQRKSSHQILHCYGLVQMFFAFTHTWTLRWYKLNCTVNLN